MLEESVWAASLASEIARRIGTGADVGPGAKPGSFWAGGALALTEHGEDGRTTARVRVDIPNTWLRRPPMVTAFARFVRQHPDWHASKGSFPLPWAASLCYVLEHEWKWFFAELTLAQPDPAVWLQCGAIWIVRNTNSLLSRHLIAERYHLQRWCERWDAWAHYEAGSKEFHEQYGRAPWHKQFERAG